MKNVSIALRLSPLFAAILLLPGCLLAAGAAAGAAGAAYVGGDLEAIVHGKPTEVAHATGAALQDLALPVHSKVVDDLESVLESETADGKDLVIRLTAEGQSRTAVSIRVGVFGNEEKSRRVLERIEARLLSA